jgi:cytochrome c biogenesis protein CcmG, thiol:disulfide interchange protein DsbE
MTRTLKVSAQVLAGALVAGLLAALIWRVAHQASPPKIGKQAPRFSLERLDGTGSLGLDKLRGKAVVVNFWASWCAPCKSESAALQRAWQKHRGSGVVVVGIDYHDVVGDAKRFVSKHELTYPILRDGDGSVGTRYDLTGVPETFFIDRRGRLVGERVQGPIDKGDNVEKFESGIRAALEPS